MHKNESQILAWLWDTCLYPVDSKNFLVGAGGIVSIKLELGDAAQEDLILTPIIDDVWKQLREVLVNCRRLQMAQLNQNYADVAILCLRNVQIRFSCFLCVSLFYMLLLFVLLGKASYQACY